MSPRLDNLMPRLSGGSIQYKPENPCKWSLDQRGRRYVPRLDTNGEQVLTTPPGRSLLGSLVGKMWNGINTVIGLAWGGLGTLFGARVSFGHNAMQFERHPFMFSDGAITIGNTISYGTDRSPDDAGAHEEQHTYQGELLGPLYLPSNILGGLAAELKEGCWHGDANWNERGPQSKEPTEW